MKMPALHVAVAGLLLLVPPVHADEHERGVCRADVEKFCQDVRPGGGAIARCLKRHESALSSVCRERLAERRQRAEEFADACGPDADKLCKQVQPGGGRVLRCLAEHRDQLSPACGEKIAEAEKRRP